MTRYSTGDHISTTEQLDELPDDTLVEDVNNIFFFKNIHPTYNEFGERVDHYWVHCFNSYNLEDTGEITLPARIRYTP